MKGVCLSLQVMGILHSRSSLRPARTHTCTDTQMHRPGRTHGTKLTAGSGAQSTAALRLRRWRLQPPPTMGPSRPRPAPPSQRTRHPGSDGLVLPLPQAEHTGRHHKGHPGEQLGDEADPAQGQGPAEADVHLVQEGPLLQETQCLLEGGGRVRDVDAHSSEGHQGCGTGKGEQIKPRGSASSSSCSSPSPLLSPPPPPLLPSLSLLPAKTPVRHHISARVDSRTSQSRSNPLWFHSTSRPSVTVQVRGAFCICEITELTSTPRQWAMSSRGFVLDSPGAQNGAGTRWASIDHELGQCRPGPQLLATGDDLNQFKRTPQPSRESTTPQAPHSLVRGSPLAQRGSNFPPLQKVRLASVVSRISH